MKIGFIGAGKVGISLGCYFYNKKESISGYYSLNDSDASQGALMTHSQKFSDLKCLVLSSDIIFITVNDDQIQKVVQTLKLLNLDDYQWDGKILVHTSGVHSHLCLKDLDHDGIEYISMHPLLPFSSIEESIMNLDKVYFSLDHHSTKVEALLERTGNPFFIIRPEDKGMYHLASVATSNFLVSVIDYALSIYQSIGVSEKHILEGVSPLISASIENVINFGTIDALTGPIKRGDVKTVQKHIESLKSKNEDDMLKLYLQLAKKNLELAEKDGVIDDGRKEINIVLDKEINKLWKK